MLVSVVLEEHCGVCFLGNLYLFGSLHFTAWHVTEKSEIGLCVPRDEQIFVSLGALST